MAVVLVFAAYLIISAILLVNGIKAEQGIEPTHNEGATVMSLREQKESEALTTYFTHDPDSWTLTDQFRFQGLCRTTGWSELRSADEAQALRDAVEGPEA